MGTYLLYYGATMKRNAKLQNLLNGTLESFYWLGFHAADGHITNKGVFILTQCEKNKEHIAKLANFLEANLLFKKSSNEYFVKVGNKPIGLQIRDMFGINENEKKTYTTINLDFLKTPEQALAFLIGYIDGDGYIDKIGYIKCQCHKSWFEVYQNLINKVPEYLQQSRVWMVYKKSHNDSFATMMISTQNTRNIKQFAILNNLPINSNKWDRVVEKRVYKQSHSKFKYS